MHGNRETCLHSQALALNENLHIHCASKCTFSSSTDEGTNVQRSPKNMFLFIVNYTQEGDRLKNIRIINSPSSTALSVLGVSSR